jgi:allene oxide cyclase-like protein
MRCKAHPTSQEETDMRRPLTITIAGIATFMLITAVTASGRTRASASAATVVVTARSTSFNTAGSGLDAVTTFTDDLFAHGRKVGRDQVMCVATGPGSFLECLGTDLLPKGQVESIGVFDPVRQSRLTVGIVGGTGAYRDARGTIDVVVLSQTKSTYVYHFDH